jgi:putative ATP-dependent endonuclease of OLD family
MFIKNFLIRNFRNINDLNLSLNKGLNIFIGENNSGKTAMIDALRICLAWGDQDKSIFVKPDDSYINRVDYSIEAKPIEFDLVFQIEDEIEQSIFYDLLCKNGDQLELQIHYRFFFEKKNDRNLFRSSVWGGDNEGQVVPVEMLNLIRHVYLGALRDASRDLQISKGNKLGNLLEKLVPENNQIELSQTLNDLLHKHPDWKELREEAREKINEHLYQSSIKGKEIKIDLRFIDSDFRRIVGDLRARLPVFPALSDDDVNQRWFQIIQNGLGDNNRIYIASVLSELLGIQNIEKESYVALLIEEPEAHLHPQLQNVLFSYFEKMSDNIQVFITSHSPTITAKTLLDTIIVFQNINNEIHTLSLKNSNLDEDDRSYLHRFLDVTKAQLFFANGVILVEGISESLLFPVFAKIMGEKKNDKDAHNLTKWGVEIVNVGGISFSHFAKIFNSTDSKKRLNSRCVIVTDSDSTSVASISERAKNALELKSDILNVQLSKKTFEYDLFKESTQNSKIMKEVYKGMHPKTEIKNADEFLEKLESNKDKGEFAQKLASRINVSNFSIPEYIKNSIEWVTQDNNKNI